MTSDARSPSYDNNEPTVRAALGNGERNSRNARAAAGGSRRLSHERKVLHHLLTPVDPPTWGPDWVKSDRRRAFLRAPAQQDEHTTIVENLEKSRQVARYKWLYILAAVLSLLVCALAMFVDYSIINGDVWTRALANEYMVVPDALKDSVIFKSLQVVFAVLAVHFMLKITGRFGRTALISVAFVLTILMIGSLGYLVAYNNMDMGTSARLEHNDSSSGSTTNPGESSIDRLLQTVSASPVHGGQRPAPQPAARRTTEASMAEFSLPLPKLSEQSLSNAQGWFWIGFASVIFFIVTTVCALYMQSAENNIRNWLIARDYKIRHDQYVELAGKE